MNLDGLGVNGMVLHYATVLFFIGTAALAFAYFWKKNRLDFDESPKFQMLKEDDNG